MHEAVISMTEHTKQRRSSKTKQSAGLNRRKMPPRKPARLPINPRWQAMVTRRLDEEGISQRELARRLGCSSGAISNLLQPPGSERKPGGSALAARVSKLLKIPEPVEMVEPELQGWIDLGRFYLESHGPEELAAIMGAITRLRPRTR